MAMSVQTTGTLTKPKVEFILPYQALPWQIAPWRDQSPVILLTGSAGGGKSKFAGEKINAACKRYPDSTGLMVRKTRESMTNTTVLFMERNVIGRDASVRHYPSKNRFEYANGSVLAYGGMKNEEQREQIRSIGQKGGLDFAWMEEANRFSEDDYNEVTARLRGTAAPWRQLLLTTNPDVPTHWIYQRLIQGGQAKVYYSAAMDNPYNPPDYLDTLANLTGVVGLRLRDGKWVQAEGAVYEDWDPNLHLVESFPIPDSWQRFRSVDFGYTNPFVCQWWALDEDRREYRYRELYVTQTLVEDLTAIITTLSEGEKATATVADHDAEDRATMHKHGVRTMPAKKDISPGIQAVQARLRKAGDGRPRLFLLRDALVSTDRTLESVRKPTCTEEEFPAYVWPKGTDGKALKEQPIGVDDHGLDALRYAVMYADRGLTGRLVR